MTTQYDANWLRALTDEEFDQLNATLSPLQKEKIIYDWPFWARPNQLPPETADWRIWLMLAGRGFGKTRAGAEWIRSLAEKKPGGRLALVAATYQEGRAVMIEGDSGLLAIAPPRDRPLWDNGRRRLVWKNGAQAFLYSAEEPDSLRGPQHHAAWCDELAKWPHLEATWMNLQMGLRSGNSPRVAITTTPRPLPLLKNLLDDATCVVTRGSTMDNDENLPRAFVDSIYAAWGKSPLGRQELGGEMVEDVEGALWSRALLEKSHVSSAPLLSRIVVAVDPSVTSGENADACGIIVAGICGEGQCYVLADKTVRGASPETWARIVCHAAHSFEADRIVAEANNGGDLVRIVLQSIDSAVPVKLVRASRGKYARAEPVAALYERGRVRHAGHFPDLEDQLCGLLPGGAYEGPGKSPDRADALVWAITDLALSAKQQPQLRTL
jgi:phage terminase large subunit-like protein